MPSFFVDPDIAKAKTIDTDFYTQQKFYDEAKEKIFAPSWQFIGDAGKIKEPGDAYPFILLENYLNEPLLLTKNKQNEIHCLSNVCTHRGNLVVYEPCKLNQLNAVIMGVYFRLTENLFRCRSLKKLKIFQQKTITCINYRCLNGANYCLQV